MARPWTWTISDTDGSNRRTMPLGQYLAEAKAAAKARAPQRRSILERPRALPRSRAPTAMADHVHDTLAAIVVGPPKPSP
jgi:hypothetical protein